MRIYFYIEKIAESTFAKKTLLGPSALCLLAKYRYSAAKQPYNDADIEATPASATLSNLIEY